MKKLLFIIFLFFSITLFSQEGVWILKNNERIDEKKPSQPAIKGLIIDFQKSIVKPVYTDTIIRFKIDRLNNKMKALKTDVWSKYKVFKNDSLIIEDTESNNKLFFYPLELNRRINKSKNEIIDLLTKKEFNKIEDSITLNFKKEIVFKHIKKRELKTNYNYDKSSGGWFLSEINSNFFLGFSFAPYVQGYDIFQITKIRSDKICLKRIIKTYYISDFKELIIKK
ncbi:hypothetical protein [Tenacibaculum aquimarinum]|uniref:hypothetical protein n=1 Tax=Tenacibaculum aquimarinum TaxID=2910675 RepID=UPI001F0AF1C8|nr:hypothetical protein [Tenacibaculum aquimarinum]MCH3883622.1 hypothetical protein [Tenacibaculum aquimarinum]